MLLIVCFCCEAEGGALLQGLSSGSAPTPVVARAAPPTPSAPADTHTGVEAMIENSAVKRAFEAVLKKSFYDKVEKDIEVGPRTRAYQTSCTSRQHHGS